MTVDECVVQFLDDRCLRMGSRREDSDQTCGLCPRRNLVLDLFFFTTCSLFTLGIYDILGRKIIQPIGHAVSSRLDILAGGHHVQDENSHKDYLIGAVIVVSVAMIALYSAHKLASKRLCSPRVLEV